MSWIASSSAGLPPDPIDIGEDLALLDHLLVDGRDRFVVRAIIDEADDREVRQQREQPREQRDA